MSEVRRAAGVQLVIELGKSVRCRCGHEMVTAAGEIKKSAYIQVRPNGSPEAAVRPGVLLMRCPTCRSMRVIGEAA